MDANEIASLTERLKHRELQIDGLTELVAFSGIKAVKLIFDQGDDLILAKSECKHGDWENWIGDNFPKSLRTAQVYMAFSAKIPKAQRVAFLKDSKGVRKSFELAGILPELPKSISSGGPIVSIPAFIEKLNWLAEWVVKNPPDAQTMEPEARIELKTKLRPIIQIYEAL